MIPVMLVCFCELILLCRMLVMNYSNQGAVTAQWLKQSTTTWLARVPFLPVRVIDGIRTAVQPNLRGVFQDLPEPTRPTTPRPLLFLYGIIYVTWYNSGLAEATGVRLRLPNSYALLDSGRPWKTPLYFKLPKKFRNKQESHHSRLHRPL